MEDGPPWTSPRDGCPTNGPEWRRSASRQSLPKIAGHIQFRSVRRTEPHRSTIKANGFHAIQTRPSPTPKPVQGSWEAAIAALGEDDPAAPGLMEVLERVRSQAQLRPLEQRIQWIQEFVARATKRVEGMREALVKTQENLRHEEALLHDGESRLLAIKEEESRRAQQPNSVEPPPKIPAQFAAELASLRECVQDLRRERDDLREELLAVGVQEENRFRKTRTLALSLALMITDLPQHPATLVQASALRNPSEVMESAINRADSTIRSMACRSRRSVARCGLRGVPVGEACHPGPSILNFGRARFPLSSSRFVLS